MKKLALFAVLFPAMITADINFTKIKGLYTAFRTKQYLSPLFGFAWWHGGQVEKMYRYGDPDHKTIKLVQELFYLNPGDGLTFAPTILPTKIGSHIGPAEIGIIAKELDTYIEKSKLEPREEQQLEKSLENALADSMKFDAIVAASAHKQQHIKSHLASEIKKAQQQEDVLKEQIAHADKEKKRLEQELKNAKQLVMKFTSQSKALKKKKAPADKLEEKNKELVAAKLSFDQMGKKFKESAQHAKQVRASNKQALDTQRRLRSKIKNAAISKQALHDFVQLLVQSFEETLPERKRYMPLTVHNILLAMLWKKAKTKKDFITYFRNLDRSVLNDSSLLADNSPVQSQWLKQQYAKKSYETIGSVVSGIVQAKTADEQRILIKNNYEALIAAWYSYDVFTSAFPPQVLAGWTSYQANDFADCGSTSLRNALNNLMYMPAAGALLLSRLAGSFKVSERVRNFYDQFGAVEQIQEHHVRDAWAAVTSGLISGTGKKIDYKSPPSNGICEIAARSGIANMNNVVRQLLDIDSIDELARIPQVKVTKQLAKDPNFGVYTFTLNDTYTFKWYFDPWHFFVSIDPAYISTDNTIAQSMQTISNTIQPGDSLKEYQSNNRALGLMLLYRDRAALFDSALSLLASKGLPNWFQDQVVTILLDVKSVHKKIQFIKQVLALDSARKDKTNIELLNRLIREIVLNVEQNYADIVQAILESPVIQDEKYVHRALLDKHVRTGMNKLKVKYPQSLPSIVDTILANKRDKYYGMLKKDVPMTQQQTDMLHKIMQVDAQGEK